MNELNQKDLQEQPRKNSEEEILPEPIIASDESVPYADFTDEEAERVMNEIDAAIRIAQSERDELYEGGAEEKWEKEQELYDGIVDLKEFPWEGAANYHIPLTAMLVDILTIKAKKQAIQPEPIVILSPDSNQPEGVEIDLNKLKDREMKNDDYLRNKLEIGKIYSSLFRAAAINGTAILKVCYENDMEWRKYRAIYTPKDMVKFMRDFPDAALEGSGNYKYLVQLKEGKTINVVIEEPVEIYEGVKAYRVPIEDFYIRPSIKDLSRQRVIAEKFVFTWNDIQSRVLNGFWDAEAVEKIKRHGGDEYQKSDYDFFEAIIKCDIKGDGRYYRYVVTYHPASRTLVRAIHYPYHHNKVYYIPYYIKPRDDCFYGYSIPERMKDLNKMVDNLWNITFDTSSIAHSPILVTDDPTLDVTAKDWGPLSVLTKTKGTELSPMKLDFPQMDSLGLFEWGIKLSEMATGISGSLMSGGELSRDPRAPAAKTAMLLRESNIIIEDAIYELQYGTAELSKQMESLCIQYNLINYDNETLRYKVNYTPQGIVIPVDKATDINILLGFIDLANKIYPELFKDADKRYLLMTIYMNLAGGMVEKYKNKILESPDEIKKKQLKEMFTQLLDEIKNQASARQKMPPQEQIAPQMLQGQEVNING